MAPLSASPNMPFEGENELAGFFGFGSLGRTGVSNNNKHIEGTISELKMSFVESSLMLHRKYLRYYEVAFSRFLATSPLSH